MTLPDIIALAVVVLAVGAAAFYIYYSKKKGQRCIGCPGGNCSACSVSSCPGKKSESTLKSENDASAATSCECDKTK